MIFRGVNMKITIEKITNKAGDKQSIRLVYYYGSHTNEAGKLVHDRKSKYLNQYLYTNPKTKLEKQHNKETLQLVEQIKSKQLAEYTKGQYGFTDIPIVFPETVKPNLLKVTLTLDLDQLIKELAIHGYQLVETNQ
jgi:hypothetical protein